FDAFMRAALLDQLDCCGPGAYLLTASAVLAIVVLKPPDTTEPGSFSNTPRFLFCLGSRCFFIEVLMLLSPEPSLCGPVIQSMATLGVTRALTTLAKALCRTFREEVFGRAVRISAYRKAPPVLKNRGDELAREALEIEVDLVIAGVCIWHG